MKTGVAVLGHFGKAARVPRSLCQAPWGSGDPRCVLLGGG